MTWLLPLSSWHALIGGLTLLFFSGTLSLAKVIMARIETRYGEDDEGSASIGALREAMEVPWNQEILSLGRVICNNTASILLFLFLIHAWPSPTLWPWLGLIVHLGIVWIATYVSTIFAPGLLGSLWPSSLAPFAVVAYRLASLVFGPFASLAHRALTSGMRFFGVDPRLHFLTEQQLELLDAGPGSEEEGALEEEGRQMIRNIFDFHDTPVREIMTPRVDVVSMELDTPVEEVIRILNHERHSRVPIYREDIDNIVGVLHNREFLAWYSESSETEPFELGKMLKPAFFVPHHKKIDDLLRELRRSGNQMAVVVDEYGGTAGVITLEDILEEIVGEIRDEDDFDEENPIQHLKDGKYLVNPVVSLGDLNEELGLELEAPEDTHVESLGGLIQATLGSIPSQGAEVDLGEVRVKILKLDGVRLEKVLLTLQPEAKKK